MAKYIRYERKVGTVDDVYTEEDIRLVSEFSEMLSDILRDNNLRLLNDTFHLKVTIIIEGELERLNNEYE